jgi:hypothetical protein
LKRKKDSVIDIHAREGTLNKWEDGRDKKSRQDTPKKKEKRKKRRKWSNTGMTSIKSHLEWTLSTFSHSDEAFRATELGCSHLERHC